MKILVTGGTGFIGRNCIERFAALGHEVHATYHLKKPFEDERVMWHQADLRENSYSSYAAMEGMDVVIHAAATTSGSKDIVNNPALHVTDNALMGSVVFRAAVAAGVKQVVFFSCTTMFTEGVITEQSEIDIHPKYFGVAHTKLYLEKMCEFYTRNSGTKFIAIRHSNVYGPWDKFDLERSHMMGATITKVKRAEDKVIVWGTGEEARDLLYVDDLVDFVELAVEKGASGLYNCGLGEAVKVKDVVQKVIDASGKNLTIEYDLTAPTIPVSLSLDCSKALQDLGWCPLVSLDEGISRTMEWLDE